MAKGPTRAIAKALGGSKASSGGKAAASASVPRTTSLCISNGKVERSVEVRKIENGYIIRESEYGGKGGYKSSERFCKDAPVLDLKGVKAK